MSQLAIQAIAADQEPIASVKLTFLHDPSSPHVPLCHVGLICYDIQFAM